MKARRLRLVLMCALLGLPWSAQAAGPMGLRGIDLSTVLGLSDQARAVPVQARAAQDEAPRLKQLKLIVLDPGHGGSNQGAIGVAEVHEKYLTLELAYALRDQLQRKYPGTRVVLTRYWDVELGLTERITMANVLGADLFISLHYNAAEHDRAVGVETYFLTTPEATPGESQVVGKPLASVHAAATGLEAAARHGEGATEEPAGTEHDAMLRLQRDLERQRQHERSGLLASLIQGQLVDKIGGVTDRGVKQANFGVLRGALMPAVVVEAGFVTHPKEGKRVARDPHRLKVVESLVAGIEAFDAKLDRAAR